MGCDLDFFLGLELKNIEQKNIELKNIEHRTEEHTTDQSKKNRREKTSLHFHSRVSLTSRGRRIIKLEFSCNIYVDVGC